ncbi:uncharacterized protein LOC127641953 [Xyrauchen texanus]|uniref:uncharacterized protein LOC127641953 n=1 Tax=Xyrauchen texanus TaxID=154827 RepID=UPI002242B8AA|nr:uncharacterized protein LOC127641953 [Xyrauchen texanus]
MTIQIPVHHMIYLKILMNHPYFILCLWQNILLKRRDKQLQGLTTRRPNDPTKSELKETLEVLLRKVDSLAATQREILILLRKCQGHQRAEDILELNIAQNKEELEALDNRLKDSDFRKRVIHHLSLIGGANPGDCVRRVMRAVATNIVWSHFSLKGKREKMPLIDTTLCKVIKRSTASRPCRIGVVRLFCIPLHSLLCSNEL